MKCIKCKEELELSCFNKDSSKSTGYYPKCKTCRAEYRAENKEHIRQKNNQYWLDNKVYLSSKNIQYYEANKAAIQEQKKEYRNKTKDTISKRDKLRYHLKKDIIAKKIEYLRERGTATLPLRRVCSFTHKPYILQRDCYKCVICLTKSNLILHHIVPVAENAAKILDLDNLVTLCKRCHLQIAHGGSFKQLNNRVQTILTTYVSII